MNNLNLRRGFAVGMVHLPPVQICRCGDWSDIRRLAERALSDALVLEDSGFDCVMVQNGKDICTTGECDNFTVAVLSEICGEIAMKLSIPLGISVLKNDAVTALSIAKVCNMSFVRCKVFAGAALGGEGIIEGCAHEAIKQRAELNAGNVELWSETYDLSSRPLLEMSFDESIKWCKKMGSDSYIVCGHNHSDTLDYCKRAKKLVGDAKVIIGGGVNLSNLEGAVAAADGFVVGSAVEKVPFTGPVCPELAREFIRRLNEIRG